VGHTKETTGLGPIISPESVSTLVHAALLRRFTSGIRISSSPPPPGAGARGPRAPRAGRRRDRQRTNDATPGAAPRAQINEPTSTK
jgi:hypothetical protein